MPLAFVLHMLKGKKHKTISKGETNMSDVSLQDTRIWGFGRPWGFGGFGRPFFGGPFFGGFGRPFFGGPFFGRPWGFGFGGPFFGGLLGGLLG